MIMNATKIEKEAKEIFSKRIVNNAEAVYQKYIVKAKDDGEKFAEINQEKVYPETMQYFKNMGYAISKNDENYQIIWDRLYEEELKKEIIQIFIFASIVLLIFISLWISLYVNPSNIRECIIYQVICFFGLPLSFIGSPLILFSLVDFAKEWPTRK